ncbi:MAG: outer membrane protein assembly factor BamC [Cellvibrionaceae bacterium]
MGRLFVLSSLIAAVTLVSGCSQNPSSHYQSAIELESLALPQSVSTDRIAELYAIPSLAEDEYVYQGDFEVPRPQPFNSETESFVKIQKLAGDNWIYTSSKPGQIWPQVQGYLQTVGIPVAKTDPKKGLIETEWLRVKGETSLKDRYRFVVEPGVARHSAEVHVYQQTSDQTTPPKTWKDEEVNPERGLLLLKQMAGYLASAQEMGSVSLLAENIGGGAKVRILVPRDSGAPHLRMRLGFDRAWATVALALQRDAFEVIREDDQQGIFYIEHILSEEEQPGLFSKLWSGVTFEQDAKRDNLFQVMLRKAGGQFTDVYIYDADAKALSADKTHEILQLIRSYLG